MDRDPCSRLGASAKDAEAIKEHPFFYGLDWKKVANKEYGVPVPEKRKLDIMSDFSKSIFVDLNLYMNSKEKKTQEGEAQVYGDSGQGSASKDGRKASQSFIKNKI